MSSSVCGRAVQTLHCTILAGIKGAQHGKNRQEPPTFSRDAATVDFMESAPRLFPARLHADVPRRSEAVCLLSRTQTTDKIVLLHAASKLRK